MRVDLASLVHVVVQSVFLFGVWEKKCYFPPCNKDLYKDWWFCWLKEKEKVQCHATRCHDALVFDWVFSLTPQCERWRLQQHFDLIWHFSLFVSGVILWKRRMLSVPCTKDLTLVLYEMTFMCLAKWFFFKSKLIDLFCGSLCVHVCCELHFLFVSFFAWWYRSMIVFAEQNLLCPETPCLYFCTLLMTDEIFIIAQRPWMKFQ